MNTRSGSWWQRTCPGRGASWTWADLSRQDDRRFSGRQSRVVLAPVAGVKFAEASRPDRAQTKP